MTMPRVLLIVGAVGGLTAWVVAQGTTVPIANRGPAAPIAPAPVIDAAGGKGSGTGAPGLDVGINRLLAGLRLMPAPSGSGRNPFRFGAKETEHVDMTSAQHRATSGPADTAEPAVTADRPPMQLLGVAEDGSGAGAVRTAVIATPRQLYLVREGEQIALRFQVVRIGNDVVELRDLANDETFPLALR
jgi:hypothetical protein